MLEPNIELPRRPRNTRCVLIGSSRSEPRYFVYLDIQLMWIYECISFFSVLQKYLIISPEQCLLLYHTALHDKCRTSDAPKKRRNIWIKSVSKEWMLFGIERTRTPSRQCAVAESSPYLGLCAVLLRYTRQPISSDQCCFRRREMVYKTVKECSKTAETTLSGIHKAKQKSFLQLVSQTTPIVVMKGSPISQQLTIPQT